MAKAAAFVANRGRWFSNPITPFTMWSHWIRTLHALRIHMTHMRGESHCASIICIHVFNEYKWRGFCLFRMCHRKESIRQRGGKMEHISSHTCIAIHAECYLFCRSNSSFYPLAESRKPLTANRRFINLIKKNNIFAYQFVCAALRAYSWGRRNDGIENDDVVQR